MNILVRKALLSDFRSIQRLHLEIEREECSFDSNLVCDTFLSEEGIKRLKKDLENKNIYYLVAELDGVVIGFIDGEIQDKYFYKEKIAYIGHLCVDRNYRNKGVAQRLLNEFKVMVRNDGAKFLKLNAFPKNNPAVQFYIKNGFGEYSILYQKEL